MLFGKPFLQFCPFALRPLQHPNHNSQAPVGDTDNDPNPLSLEDMLANRSKFVRLAAGFRDRVRECSGDTAYMRYRLGRKKALILATDMMMYSLERPFGLLFCSTPLPPTALLAPCSAHPTASDRLRESHSAPPPMYVLFCVASA